jgi:hypothetical protein
MGSSARTSAGEEKKMEQITVRSGNRAMMGRWIGDCEAYELLDGKDKNMNEHAVNNRAMEAGGKKSDCRVAEFVDSFAKQETSYNLMVVGVPASPCLAMLTDVTWVR